ncbi:HAD-like domain-containing protein [Chaetomidium leptoderma]|uniref:HAD-like domain-containing protein n=1 Tax=Chaetomidium leptoderma TaxID=669021 RepID=A0AAN6VDG2_9PEZI|nr:HAD-like domain-containing protein [Chaetomidium leptoderma]
MGRRNLLLCFDAFGTLFHPKRPIAEQYTAVARQCGLDGFSTEQVHTSFRTAFSRESKAHPNYGKASGMGAKKWWTTVIHNTFRPLVGPGRELPQDLAPRLLHRFCTGEGYTLSPGVTSLLRSTKQQQRQQTSSQIVVGVITNSDDRVPGILSSLGLRVSPLRVGSTISLAKVADQQYDIDLHCMSYDVGFEKPDRRIFDAAEETANQLAAAQRGTEPGRDGERAKEAAPWLKLYVGDEYKKDVLGARGAGWNSVFVGTDENVPGQENLLGLPQLNDKTLDEVFPQGAPPVTIRAESTQELLEWLGEQYARGG